MSYEEIAAPVLYFERGVYHCDGGYLCVSGIIFNHNEGDTVKVKDVYKGEHFEWQGGLYRRTAEGWKFVLGLEPKDPLTVETEVTRVSGLYWRPYDEEVSETTNTGNNS
jgi:hypothetical protein